MNLYFNYIKECRGLDVVGGMYGFATYLIAGEECYIEDVYVEPESRKNGIGAEFVERIKMVARDKGCKVITTTVHGTTKSPEISLMSCFKVGFKIFSIGNGTIFLKMEL